MLQQKPYTLAADALGERCELIELIARKCCRYQVMMKYFKWTES
jgi:hypothetical protein